MNGEVRAIDSGIGKVFPVVDIAENIGYSRSAITKAIKEFEDSFKGCTLFLSLPTSGGDQQFLCLNEVGVERLLLLIRPQKAKKDLCERVEAFRAMAFGKLADNKPVLIEPPHNGNGDLKHEIERARIAAEATGGNLAEFQKIALKKCGFEEYIPALNATSMIHGETGWHNPSSLITLCNDPDLTPERLNFYLRNKGFQYKDGYIWRLTPEGMEHGEEYWYTSSSKHSEIRIRWRDSVLYASGLLKRQSDTLALSPARV